MTDKPLIMFDFDGVIVDTLGISYGINLEINKDLPLEEYVSWWNGNIYDRNKEKYKKHPDFHGRYAEESRKIVVPEEIRILLRSLAQKYSLAIISGSRTSSIVEVLEREGVRDCFADVLGYDVDTSKVVRIRSLLDQYGVDPKDTVFITDTAGDVTEAHECKVASIAVTWGFQTKETLAYAKPMAFVDTVGELAAAIQRFFSATI